tara:strand:+ start:278 stop:820 length:543 start_codon:yes stop_codon:yes gene_type:complete
MIRSGVYFLGGDKRVRIGEAKDLEKRIKTHISSRANTDVIDLLECLSNETKKEEKLAQDYFKEYHDRDSFYFEEIRPLIPGYIKQRKLDRINFNNKLIIKKGTINTLWGPETITNHLPRCDMFPELYAGYMGRKDTKSGLKPRSIVIEGKRYYQSELFKKWYQKIARHIKEQIREGNIKL